MTKTRRAAKEPVTVEKLQASYAEKQAAIRARLAEFHEIGAHADDAKLFEELIFCIFTAGASARMGLKCVERVRPVLFDGDETAIYQALNGAHLYPRDRARYIIHTRNYLQDLCELKMRKLLASQPEAQA